MVEEEHVSQYGSLLNPNLSWLENLLVHQYTECWLYWSCHETETDARIREIWGFMFEQELMHLHIAQGLLKECEGKEWRQVIPDGEFPHPLRLESNIPYVRQILGGTVCNTALRETYEPVDSLPRNGTFADYQRQVNQPIENVTSHSVIEEYIRQKGQDYRYETAPNPVPPLRDRSRDDTQVGRLPEKVLEKV